MEKKISVIIPVYNLESCLDNTVKSVIRQSYRNIEILLIDDGSTDNTLEVCKKWENNDKRIKVFHQKNLGVSAARNKGLLESSGELLCFIDGDDLVDENLLKKLYQVIEDADLAICGLRYLDDCKIAKSVGTVSYSIEDAIIELCENDFISYSACAKLYKSDIAKTISFDNNTGILEDYLFVCSYLCKCKKVNVITEYLYYYVRRENSALGRSYSHKRLDLIYSYCKSIQLLKDFYPKVVPYIYCCYMYELMELFSRIPDDNEYENDRKKISDEIYRIKRERIKGNYRRIVKIRLFQLSPQFYKVIMKIYRNR